MKSAVFRVVEAASQREARAEVVWRSGLRQTTVGPAATTVAVADQSCVIDDPAHCGARARSEDRETHRHVDPHPTVPTRERRVPGLPRESALCKAPTPAELASESVVKNISCSADCAHLSIMAAPM